MGVTIFYLFIFKTKYLFIKPIRTFLHIREKSIYMIISGSSSSSLATSLSIISDIPLAQTENLIFPDGEHMIKIDLEGDRCTIVASTLSPLDHIELLQLQDAAREAGASHITTILPYMGYSRQDTVFEPGQSLSSRAIAKSISTGTDRVIVVNPHKDTVCDHFTVPAISVDASSVLAQALPSDLESPTFIAPDSSAIFLAKSVQNAYGSGETDYFNKKRISGTEVIIYPGNTDVEGKDVVCIDDIISTGTTTSKAAKILLDNGALRVFSVCVHALLVGQARKMLLDSGVDSVYTTDTIQQPETTVSVAPVLADLL